MTKLLNFVLFQVGWFACVLSAADGRAWIGAAVVAMIAAVHLARNAHPSREAALFAIAGAFGLLADTGLLLLGGLTFASSALDAQLAPYWMGVMWINFAMTLNYSLAWLQSHIVTALVLGGLFGPLAYYAGERLGALEVTHADLTYVGASLVWAAALPLLLWVAARMNPSPTVAATIDLK